MKKTISKRAKASLQVTCISSRCKTPQRPQRPMMYSFCPLGGSKIIIVAEACCCPLKASLPT